MGLLGVICCSLTDGASVRDTVDKLLDLKQTTIENIPCSSLELKNKYYQATVHLIDYDSLPVTERTKQLLESCQAIILYGDGRRLTVDKLDQKVKELESVGGEPRILLYEGIDEECEPYKTLRDWSIKNSFDFIDTNDDATSQLIDSLSAYKWTNRINTNVSEDKPQLNDEMLKKLNDFDNLLGKLSAYRDTPELRGNPDDKNIEEIAEILSGLLGDDVDGFLDNEDD